METPWLTDEEQLAWRAFLALSTLVPAAIERDLQRDSGLSAADYRVMSTVSEKPGQQWPLRELAASMLWSRSRLSHHLDRMGARGLVARSSDPEDKRGCMVTLTDHGVRVLAAAAPPHVRSVRKRVIDQMTPAELEVFGAVARRLAEAAASDQE